MAINENTFGSIEISATAIANLVSQVVTQTYGVVGMTTPNLAADIAATLTRDPHRGVVVNIKDNYVEIDLHVILKYGTRIASVATTIINTVRYTVEKHSGFPVRRINVNVQGLRVSQDSKK